MNTLSHPYSLNLFLTDFRSSPCIKHVNSNIPLASPFHFHVFLILTRAPLFIIIVFKWILMSGRASAHSPFCFCFLNDLIGSSQQFVLQMNLELFCHTAPKKALWDFCCCCYIWNTTAVILFVLGSSEVWIIHMLDLHCLASVFITFQITFNFLSLSSSFSGFSQPHLPYHQIDSL